MNNLDKKIIFNINNITLSIVTILPYISQFVMQVTFARYLSVDIVSAYAAINIFLLILLNVSNMLADKFIIVTRNISDESINRIFTIELLFSAIIFGLTYLIFRDVLMEIIDIENSYFFWLLTGCLICFYNPLSRTKAILEKNKEFIFAFLPLCLGHILAALVAVYLLEKGLSIWAMIIWRFLIYFLEIILLFFFSPYRPRINLNIGFKDFYLFSYPLYLVSIFSIILVNLDYFLVIALIGEQSLGIYWMAFSLSHIILNIRDIVQKILLPNLASYETQESKKAFFIKFMNQMLFILLFLSVLVTYIGNDLVLLLLGEKWIETSLLFVVLYYAATTKFYFSIFGSYLIAIDKGFDMLPTSIIQGLISVVLFPLGLLVYEFIGLSIALFLTSLITLFYFEWRYLRSNLGKEVQRLIIILGINIILLMAIFFIISSSLIPIYFKIILALCHIFSLILLFRKELEDIFSRFLTNQL